MDAFLGVERTGFSYLAETSTSPQVPTSREVGSHYDTLEQEGVVSGTVLSAASAGDGLLLDSSKKEEEPLTSVSLLEWPDDGPVPTNVTAW